MSWLIFDPAILELFAAEYATEAVSNSWNQTGFMKRSNYIEDPRTAVASAVYQKYRTATGDKTTTVVASTASPYKFQW